MYIRIHSRKNSLQYGSIHSSLNYGLFKILDYKYTTNGTKYYNIEFINTGYIGTASVSHINDGHVKDYSVDDNIGKIFSTCRSGNIEIISRDNVSKTRYLIRFIDTGNTTVANISNIMSGKVSDKSLWDAQVKTNSIYHTNNFGDIIVLEKFAKYSKIKFIDTGYETTVKTSNILYGKVKDFCKPNKYGGFIGKDYKKLRNIDPLLWKNLYSRWSAMIYRCYNKSNKWYCSYGSKGVKVSDEWLEFCVFYKDAQLLPGFDRDKVISGELELDKDKLQQNKKTSDKIYGRDTCVFIYREENQLIRNSK